MTAAEARALAFDVFDGSAAMPGNERAMNEALDAYRDEVRAEAFREIAQTLREARADHDWYVVRVEWDRAADLVEGSV